MKDKELPNLGFELKRNPFGLKESSALLDELTEKQRLGKLTNAELVAECLKTDAADAVVEEMMDRLDPGRFEERE